MVRYSLALIGLFLGASLVDGHAPPIYVPAPPFHVQGRSLVDSTNTSFLLRGVQMPDLSVGSPITFRTIQQRWNLNAVRIPISIPLWRRDGAKYVEQVRGLVALATAERLIVILAAADDPGTGLPPPDAVDFWRAFAAAFKDSPRVVFSVFNHASTRTDWRAWQTAMQPLADAIRSAGATQILSFSSFDDPMDFQGFGPDFAIRDANAMYEAHLFYDHAATDSQREANLGFLTAQFPVYAGEWGMPFGSATAACRAVPADVAQQHSILLQTLVWFDTRGVSWTIDDFNTGNLVQDFSEYNGTSLDKAGTCDSTNQSGIGVDLLLWTTGDPGGFGSLLADLIANAAGGPARPPSPGELMSIYGQGLGPDEPATAQLDAAGNLSTSIGGTQVLFDGVPVPMLLSSLFQINLQVPFELAGKKETTMQLFRNGVPSNKLKLPVLDVDPQIFARFGLPSEAALLNQDATLNTSNNPAPRGTIISLFATGAGLFTPSTPTGAPAQSGLPQATVRVRIGGQPATLFYAGVAPGLVGLLQVNAQVPASLPVSPQRADVILEIGGQASRSGLTLWIQ